MDNAARYGGSGSFGDDPQQAFGPDEEARQLEAGFIFVSAAAKPDNGTIRQDHLQP